MWVCVRACMLQSKNFQQFYRKLLALTGVGQLQMPLLPFPHPTHQEFSLPALQLSVREAESHLLQDTASTISIGNIPVLSFARCASGGVIHTLLQ